MPQMCLHACYSEVLLCFEMIFSGVHEAIIKLIILYIHETRGRKFHYDGVGMAFDVATLSLSLILYHKVYNH